LSMTSLTTIKVSIATRDELKAIAEREGLTLDDALRRLLRSERQRQMGADLASQPRSAEDSALVSGLSGAVGRALG
jgi:antitoxin component of RelBE/YafQ-DinJ toxin-antitoxin module